MGSMDSERIGVHSNEMMKIENLCSTMDEMKRRNKKPKEKQQYMHIQSKCNNMIVVPRRKTEYIPKKQNKNIIIINTLAFARNSLISIHIFSFLSFFLSLFLHVSSLPANRVLQTIQ